MTFRAELPRALLAALRFDAPRLDILRDLDTSGWKEFLGLADRERMTLALALRCQNAMPDWVAERVTSDLKKNALRQDRIYALYQEIGGALRSAGIEFAVLKGFTHSDGYVEDAAHRRQGDLDLLVPRAQILRAKDILISLRYEPVSGFENLPLDHLPVMIRKSNWKWQGDYFAVDAPLAVELHFQLWDPTTERIDAEGVEEFWNRRYNSALCSPDRLAYACLHLLRHLLRGDVRLFHVYEVAHFLDRRADDDAFWLEWQGLHSAGMRSLEAIAFALAQAWFGCRLSSIVKAEIEQLPPSVALWFTHFGMSIADASVTPNKNELWLHLSLLRSRKDRFAVAARRLMPLRRSRGILNPLVPDESVTWKLRAERQWFRIRFTIGRLIHHFRASIPTALTGLKWFAVRKGVAPQFLVFLVSASLFNFGLTIFYLLYNLLLLEQGFHEDLLGAISSAMSAGSIAGTIPAAFMLRRFGVRTTIVGAFVSIAFISVIRATVFHPAVLVASGFAGGFCFASYAVTIAPAVAQWTPERARPLGFSLVFSLGIGIGVLGNVVGGRLPGLFERSSLQAALLVGIAIAALGALPALLLRTSAPMSESQSRVYPRGVFIVSFLGAILIWNVATSMINPFLSAYFVRIAGLATAEIGVLFSFGQAAQVVAVLAAPFLLKRLGVIPGIIGMQVATAVSALIFGLQPTGWLVALPFAAYMAFQYMSEPGMNSLLMSEVAETERSGASALNFLVIFTGQAIGAVVAGVAARRFGYPVVFSIATFLMILAALAFRYVGAHKN